ncbi:DUF1972 domain-containing protein [uncultured Hoeflea sp.]|uniref:DUF1972 domain-containing protein n=1 Tax=uncultured Hoeflea sp. TaxID=538666 RepID=UPI0030DD9A16
MKIAIVGTVGVPGRYGGFETLAENLVRQHHSRSRDADLTVYCSAEAYSDRTPAFLTATLRYSRFKANGLQSIVYDAVTLFDAARRGHDVALLLGVSGAVALPFIRLFSGMRIVTNVDGIEWRRSKWNGPVRQFLRLSEWMAVRFSHQVVADNEGIADHIRRSYGVHSTVIAYGGDHALDRAGQPAGDCGGPAFDKGYALALCRIEPENHVSMILEAFAATGRPLVFVGNWNNSAYGRDLRERYAQTEAIHLLDPIYDAGALYRIRANSGLYVHGHSAGGTNPALVEMMHFGLPILAFDCVYNRYTTENQASFFSSAGELARIATLPPQPGQGAMLRAIARRRYIWSQIGNEYFELLGVHDNEPAMVTEDTLT